jgi:hypothetical protein
MNLLTEYRERLFLARRAHLIGKPVLFRWHLQQAREIRAQLS